MHATCHAHLIFLDLVIQITSYEAPYYTVLSSLLLFHPPLVQMFSSAPCSEIPSVCFPPLMSETIFDTHNYRQHYSFVYFKFYVLDSL
jgi:hypothetical protein